jgi:hypothetical protein
MKQVSLVLQFAHDVPDRGRRDTQSEPARNHLTARRFRRLDVAVHHSLENAQLALCKLIRTWHDAKSRASRGW